MSSPETRHHGRITLLIQDNFSSTVIAKSLARDHVVRICGLADNGEQTTPYPGIFCDLLTHPLIVPLLPSAALI
jgi:hypothetical protein